MPEYGVFDGYLKIVDEEMGVHFVDTVPFSEAEAHIVYDKDGRLFWKAFYLHGKLHGVSETYFDNGSFASRSWYIHGEKTGKSYFYRPDGSLYSLKRFAKGELQGRQEYYYENGATKAELVFENGLLSHVLEYHENGKKMREIELRNGKRQGSDISFAEDGRILFQLEYEQAKCVKKVVDDKLAQHYQL